ncbi:MAG: hypothetical protein ACLFO2_02200 [Candidatus Woesearchaeota archaeon]
MKTRIDDLQTTYDACVRNGRIREKHIDFELIRSIKKVAERGLAFIRDKATTIPRKSDEWTFVFRDHYEALRGLIEAILLFDGVAAENHQCKNACLCTTHQDLGFDWEFLETARLTRNAINYRGLMLDHDTWNGMRLKFDLHLKVLSRVLEEKLEETG